MPKNPLQDPGMAAMQKGLMGAKKNKAMKPPVARAKTSSSMVKNVKVK